MSLKKFLQKYLQKKGSAPAAHEVEAPLPPTSTYTLNPIAKDVDAVYNILVDIIGSEKLVLKAGKLDAINLLRSAKYPERVLALQKIIYEAPTLETLPTDKEIPDILTAMTEKIADIVARRNMEEKIEKRIAEAKKLGFTKAIAPSAGKKNSFINGVKDLRQALIDYMKS